MVYNMNKFNNCKTLKEIINLIDYKIFERVAFILLILWSINPIVEYFFKNIIMCNSNNIIIYKMNQSKEEEVDELSVEHLSIKKRGPISQLLYSMSLRKLSNKSDTSKSSISTQYTYVNNENRIQQDNLSEISDFDLDEDDDSFHSSMNNSMLSAEQVVNLSGEFTVDDNDYPDEDNLKAFSKGYSKSINKPLIDLSLCKM